MMYKFTNALFFRKVLIITSVCLLFGCEKNDTHNLHINNNLRNDYSISAMSPAVEKYFHSIKQSSQNALTKYDESKLNDEAIKTIKWMNKVLGKSINPDPYILPHALSATLRKMYLKANQHEEKVGIKLYKTPLASDEIWANCGSSSGALIKLLGHFDIPARLITVWNIPTSTHALLEYYSQTFNKWVMYDPFYGVIMLDDNGNPAGVADMKAKYTDMALM